MKGKIKVKKAPNASYDVNLLGGCDDTTATGFIMRSLPQCLQTIASS
jgi:hypothetical protein